MMNRERKLFGPDGARLLHGSPGPAALEQVHSTVTAQDNLGRAAGHSRGKKASRTGARVTDNGSTPATDTHSLAQPSPYTP